jgi:hypothetical protein
MLVDRPVLWAVFWLVNGTLLVWHVVVMWRRGAPALMCAGPAIAVAASVVMVRAALAGYSIMALPRPWMPVFWLTLAVMLGTQSLAWRVHRDVYRRWRELAERESLSMLDMLTLRRFPDLRDRGSLG